MRVCLEVKTTNTFPSAEASNEFKNVKLMFGRQGKKPQTKVLWPFQLEI